jgi:hypothetical protein
VSPLEEKIRAGVAQVASALRAGALDKKRRGAAGRHVLKPPFAFAPQANEADGASAAADGNAGEYALSAEAAAEGEAAALAVESLGLTVAAAFGGAQVHACAGKFVLTGGND